MSSLILLSPARPLAKTLLFIFVFVTLAGTYPQHLSQCQCLVRNGSWLIQGEPIRTLPLNFIIWNYNRYLLHSTAIRFTPIAARRFSGHRVKEDSLSEICQHKESNRNKKREEKSWWDLCLISSCVHIPALFLVYRSFRIVPFLPKLWLSSISIVSHEQDDKYSSVCSVYSTVS